MAPGQTTSHAEIVQGFNLCKALPIRLSSFIMFHLLMDKAVYSGYFPRNSHVNSSNEVGLLLLRSEMSKQLECSDILKVERNFGLSALIYRGYIVYSPVN